MKFKILVLIGLSLQVLFGCMSKEKLEEKEAVVIKERLKEYLLKNDSARILKDSTHHDKAQQKE